LLFFPDGAAYRSGIRQGDRILKVNGMPVNHANHLEVVRMISNGQTVALTLLGAPPEFSADQQQQQQTSTNNNTATPFVNHRKALKTGFITSPRPLSSVSWMFKF
jgi:C-terminal processing protease CtpA/Prc